MPHPADWEKVSFGVTTRGWQMKIHGAVLFVVEDSPERYIWGVRWPKQSRAGTVVYLEQRGGHGVAKSLEEATEAALESARQGRPPLPPGVGPISRG